jgi:hypothetical protein
MSTADLFSRKIVDPAFPRNPQIQDSGAPLLLLGQAPIFSSFILRSFSMDVDHDDGTKQDARLQQDGAERRSCPSKTFVRFDASMRRLLGLICEL